MAESMNNDIFFSSDDELDDDVPVDGGTLIDCEGIPRKQWVGKFVTLLNANGENVATGICRNVRSSLVLGASAPLADSHVAVQIGRILVESEFAEGSQFNIVSWPIERVFCRGASF